MKKGMTKLRRDTINSKGYILLTKGSQSIDDATPHEQNYEDFDPIGPNVKQVVIVLPINTKLSTEEDGSLCDAETFYHIGAITFIPRMTCILKFVQ